MRNFLLTGIFITFAVMASFSQKEVDTYKTSKGDLKITFLGHGTLMFEWNNQVIHVDPVSKEADYTTLPKADLILVTHEHGDHLDQTAINTIKKDKTTILLTQICFDKIKEGIVLKNGEKKIIGEITVDAVPAYNIQNKRNDGKPFHPKGEGNGYVLTLGDKKVYIAGDTENIPEMKDLKNIDIAFLPMNLPYTMTPEMTADAAKMVKPKVLYPYHYGNTQTAKLTELLKNEKGIEVKIRTMK
jgi:L-ascorbate metabolism protein UlaG (beta-lactamase superfamily)